jgi:hypothetical protein
VIFDLPIRRAERSFDGETRRKRGVSLAGYCVKFKGDDPVNETQSTSNANQTDQRVGASDSAVAVGAGGFLDQSFVDQSQTTLNTYDQSDHSLRQAFTDSHNFTDNSQTTLNTSDNRDQSTHFTDNSQTTDARDLSQHFTDQSNRSVTDNSNRSVTDNSQITLNTSDNRDQSTHFADSRDLSQHFTDNSTTNITTLDSELAKAAVASGAGALKDAGTLIERQVAANLAAAKENTAAITGTTQAALAAATRAAEIAAATVDKNSAAGWSFAGQSLEQAFDTAETLAGKSIADAAAARSEQTAFLSQFYTDRAGTDAKAAGDLIKYGAAVAALGLAFLIFKGRKAA